MNSTEVRFCKTKGIYVLLMMEDVYDPKHNDLSMSVKCLSKPHDRCPTECPLDFERELVK